ncbi:hypothetical protein TH53_06790 [Pedobacter lusitanus]|uniref:Uncharacterized protein n=1 Tax=Pedobacter lusitanus TaxID=1503925 RepID=A0A0D0GNY6_9SPHI|nr:aminoglycoside 6-adenylyltransferase [Pedobacter lusitanus]KIO77840.1 hypothetical protein TH53_06790 [Pedobacter lusitanus]
MTPNFEIFIENNKDIQAVISFGSSGNIRSDKYSDVDLVLFTSSPSKYINENDSQWTADLGNVLSRVVFRDLVNYVEVNKLVMETGPALDLLIIDIAVFTKMVEYRQTGDTLNLPAQLLKLTDTYTYRIHYQLKRGYKMVFDASDVQRTIDLMFKYEGGNEDRNLILNENTFESQYNRFWQTCYKVNTWLICDETQYAMITLDNILKRNLILVLQWQTLLEKNDKSYDVFYDGAKLKEWCDPAIVKDLFNIFSYNSKQEIRKAVLHTMRLYINFSHRVAASKGYTINQPLEKEVLHAFSQEQFLGTNTTLNKVVGHLNSIAGDRNDIHAILFTTHELCYKDSLTLEIDCFLITSEPDQYAEKDIWYKYFDHIFCLSRSGDGFGAIIHLLFKDGFCLNVTLIDSLDVEKCNTYFHRAFYQALHKGYKLIYAKQGVSERIQSILHDYTGQSGIVDEKNFYANYNRFWQTTNKMAAKMVRKDFYYTILEMDNLMKSQVVRMLEWYTAIHDHSADIYPNAKKMHLWCDPVLYQELSHSFPHSGMNEMLQSIILTMNLYRKISSDVAAASDFSLNDKLEQKIYDTVMEISCAFSGVS